jgi:hypothetical protein
MRPKFDRTVLEALNAARRRLREIEAGSVHAFQSRDAALRDAQRRVNRLEDKLYARRGDQ